MPAWKWSLVLMVTSLPAFSAVSWSTCPVWTPEGLPYFKQLSCSPPASTVKAECATLQVPLDYKNTSAGTIDYFVKRIPALQQPATGQVWLINGGPGNSGVLMECMLGKVYSMMHGRVDILIPDHRGTGRSSPLFCDKQGRSADNSRACVTQAIQMYGMDYLQHFSATNAANDIKAGIDAIPHSPREDNPDYAVMIHGVSYGTYLTQRFLQLFPTAADAVLLDGVCAPDLIRIEWSSLIDNAAGFALAAECAKNHVCSDALSGNPGFSLQLVFELLHAGKLQCNQHLKSQVSSTGLRGALGSFVRDPLKRLLIFPVVTRLLRCNEADVEALNLLLGIPSVRGISNSLTLTSGQGDLPSANATLVTNNLLGFFIGSTEFSQYSHEPLTAKQVEDIDTGMLLTNAGDSSLFDPKQAPGFVPFTDPLSHKYPNTSTRLMMISGTLDPQTPPEWAEHAMSHYTHSSQRLVKIPYGVHAAASLPGRGNLVRPDCGFELAASFFGSSGKSVDTSCLEQIEAPDFGGLTNRTKQMSLESWGTTNLWGTP